MRRIALALMLALTIPHVGHSQPTDVSPGTMYRGELLDIRSPNSDGWMLAETSPGNWTFVTGSRVTKDTYAASVMSFPLTETRSHEEYLALVKDAIDKASSPDRFTIIGEELQYTEARGYPCAAYKATIEDRKVKTSFFKRETQLLEVHALYCRHPARPTLGFAIVFSHRGPELDPYLNQQAQDFIDGVQVPSAASPPESPDNLDDT
jgi:hypothetical protein